MGDGHTGLLRRDAGPLRPPHHSRAAECGVPGGLSRLHLLLRRRRLQRGPARGHEEASESAGRDYERRSRPDRHPGWCHLARVRHRSLVFRHGDSDGHHRGRRSLCYPGKTGLVAFDPEDEDDPGWVTAELVVSDELDKWRQSKQAGAGRDLRLIGDIRVSGSREVTFLDALARSRQVPTPELPGWPHAGERGAHEFMRGLKMSGLEWISHHNDFIAKSGISRGSGICRSHRRISESLALMMQWDQIDLCNSAAAECLIRFLIAIVTAVRRNPRAPDFTLFDEISGQGLDEVGGLVLPGYTKWLADVQRDKAQVLKQQRLWSEEQGKWGKTGDHGGGGGGGGGGGSAVPSAKAKGSGKGKGGRGGGADADP